MHPSSAGGSSGFSFQHKTNKEPLIIAVNIEIQLIRKNRAHPQDQEGEDSAKKQK
jgi:hypothetical protein